MNAMLKLHGDRDNPRTLWHSAAPRRQTGLAIFHKAALAEAKRLVNRRTLPRAEDLIETQESFLAGLFVALTSGARGPDCGDGPMKLGPNSNFVLATTS